MSEFIMIFLHLFSAIIFVGYVFVDSVLCYKLKEANELKKAYFKSLGILYAFSFLVLIFSGIYLAYSNFAYINKFLLFFKIAFILLMLFVTFLSIYFARFKNNKEHFLVKQAHLIALILCFFIILLAKLLIIL